MWGPLNGGNAKLLGRHSTNKQSLASSREMKGKFVKKILFTAVALAASAAAPAQAAITIVSSSFDAITGPAYTPTTSTFGYSDTGLTSPTFSETVTFNNTLAGVYDLALSTSNFAVDFTRAYLIAPGGGEFDLTKLADNGSLEFWGVSSLTFQPGTFTLNILGNNRGAGTLDGSVTVVNQLPAVPEPATWALLILGFGAVGASLRRRNNSVRVSKASLRFA